MIPILYESDEISFDTNGLGRLRDCISCIVTEERNGVYECDFEYPVGGQNYDRIQLGRIIAVEHDYSNDVQPFDIVSASKPIDGIVQFHAVHISYRQSKLTTSGTNINSLADAFTMLGNSTPANPFTYETDKTATGFLASANDVPRSVRSFLGGVEGSILDAYGGEYEWDKFTVKLWDARGEDRNITIRYGVNLVDFTDDTDYQNTFNACVAYWTGQGDDGSDIVVKTGMLDSGLTDYVLRTECVPLDLTDKFEEQPTVVELEAMAQSYMTSNQVNLPQQNIKVDFVQLEDSPEYEYFAPLANCKLCDTVRVVFPMYNFAGTFKIVKTTYNVLLERFDELELGTLSTTLAEALGISGDSLNKLSQTSQTVQTGTALTTTVANTTKTNTISVALSKGIWIVVYQAALPIGTSKQFQSTISNGSTDIVAQQNGTAITGLTRHNVTAIVELSDLTMIYGTMYHNSGSTLTINTNKMWAVRIS